MTLDSNNGSSAFIVRDSASNELAHVQSDGKVGIGTATPSDNLSVSKASGSSVSIGTGMAPGSIGSPLYTDLNFRGYLDDIRARIRSWDQSSSSGYGQLSFWTKGISNLTEKMRIDENGKVGIGTTTPAERLDVSGNIRIPNNSSFVGASVSGDSFQYDNGTFKSTLPRYSLSWVNLGSTAEAVMSSVGGIKLLIGADNTGAYVDGAGVHSYSDIRLKKNIVPMSNMLEKVLQMQGVTFNLKVNDQASFGFIAQDLETVFPLAVNTGADSYKSVNYAAMSSVLVEAIKELKAENDAEIATLKAENDDLKARLEALEAKIK